MNQAKLSHEQYGLLFDIRRSARYHERRRVFFEGLHRITSFLTILLAGGVLFELAGTGSPAKWLQCVSLGAGSMAAVDLIVGFAARATQHAGFRSRYVDLEIAMIGNGDSAEVWQAHRLARLAIERDEPPVYRALDLLCRNEMLQAEGFSREKQPEQFSRIGWWPQLTSHFWHWQNLSVS